MTAGEKRLARALESLLEDDYMCWYDVPVGPRNLHPDFVILNPRRGLLILEVKDWKLESIQQLTRQEAVLLTSSGPKRTGNPLEQARQYAHVLAGLLRRDPALVQQQGDYQGNLRFAWGYGLVLGNITRKQFESTDLHEVLNPSQVICADELSPQQDAETFQQRLWQMFTVRFTCLLSAPEIERIRWHLFPELRLQGAQASLFAESDSPEQILAAIPDLIRVMDLQQEQVARNLGDGHRVIHGVAGSGKTMILGYRCLHLARTQNKPILVLCFNKALAAKLQHMMASHGVTDKVSVQHFHGWCGEQLRLYQVTPPGYGPSYLKSLVDAVMQGLEHGQIPRNQYGAVLIDEGHDFEPDWFRLIVGMVDPQTNSLLVLYDDAQALYGNRRQFSFSSVGIQARGRTTILRLNYRNTAEVLRLAMDFAREWLAPQDAEEDGVPLVPPESIGRHGEPPRWEECDNDAEELQRIIQFLSTRHGQLGDWSQLAVLGRTNDDNVSIVRALQQAGIPVEQVNSKGNNTALDPGADSVKVVTLHSSKGLEFDSVAIPFIGRLPHAKAKSVADEARLLYVGMTRATDHLLLTASQSSPFTQRLREVATGVTQRS
ncbi:DNA helicase II [Pseudomonas cavernae]|uniref:DNA 3'-5' helicase n=2 Tax=Pseudomonas cavernae TaxID=2320867 RepID=A0A385Z769_9PSED|nr:DNA helicase II [Pseudomonas cavernae]